MILLGFAIGITTGSISTCLAFYFYLKKKNLLKYQREIKR